MVRGRRTRKAAASTTATTAANNSSASVTTTTSHTSPKSSSLSPIANNGAKTSSSSNSPLTQQNGGGVKVLSKNGSVILVDDLCCASPKRKEYKIDELLIKNGATHNGFVRVEGTEVITTTTTTNNNNHSSSSPPKTRMVLRGTQNGNTGGGPVTNGRLCTVAGNEITRFLLTQSKSKSRKTRKKSPNFELVNDDTCDSFTHATSLQEAPSTTTNSVVKMEAEEESTPNSVSVKAEADDEAAVVHPFQMFGRLPIGSGMVPEENIFLQEPVLKLTVDDAACVLVQPKSEQGGGGGGEEVVVGSVVKQEKKSNSSNKNGVVAVINQDSNSGDSGVVVDKVVSSSSVTNGETAAAAVGVTTPKPLVTSASRPRVPTTPHRILCPSVNGNGNEMNGNGGSGVEKEEEELEGMQVEEEDEDVPMTNRKLILPTNDDGEEEEEDKVKPLTTSVKQETATTTMKAPKPVASNTATGVRNGASSPSGVTKNGHQSHMEDFFKVRRSVRKTKKEVEREEQLAIEKAILSECDVGLAVKMFENKGRGIVATRPFARGEFVVEYVGEFISMAEANRREKLYAQDQNTGCYMYYFKHKNKQYCIDATEETGKLGRLVNHSRNGNLMTRTVEVKGQPHLVLIAKEDIEEGKELNYDYGDRSKESLLHHPWLAY